ncbi:MAG: S26 family signal peptidase, partial [Cetobacterium sp.]
KFLVNGISTGMILDFIHDENILNRLLKGETVETTLDQDYYLALGDNTTGSYDSRMWGFVKDSRIKGKAVVRFWPLNRIGLLK